MAAAQIAKDKIEEKTLEGYEAAKQGLAHGYDVAKEKIVHVAEVAAETTLIGYETAKIIAGQTYDYTKEKASNLAHGVSEEVVYLGKEAKEGVEHTLEKAKEGLADAAHWVMMSSRKYYDALTRKFDQFTHISTEEYETAKAKLAEIKRQTFELIDLAKQKGIVLSEDLIRETRETFAQQENELEEMALKVRENVEKDQGSANLLNQPIQSGEKVEVRAQETKKKDKIEAPPPLESLKRSQKPQTSGWRDVPITSKPDAGKIWKEIGKTKGEEMFKGVPIKEKKEDYERIKEGTKGQYKKKDL